MNTFMYKASCKLSQAHGRTHKYVQGIMCTWHDVAKPYCQSHWYTITQCCNVLLLCSTQTYSEALSNNKYVVNKCYDQARNWYKIS